MPFPIAAAIGGATALGGLAGLFQKKDKTAENALKWQAAQTKKALGEYDQLGLTQQQQIQQKYLAQLGKLQGNLTDRGLTNSTVAASLAQGLNRQRGQDATSARANLALSKAGLRTGQANTYANLAFQLQGLNQQQNQIQGQQLGNSFAGVGGAISNWQNQNQFNALLKSLQGGGYGAGGGGTWVNGGSGVYA